MSTKTTTPRSAINSRVVVMGVSGSGKSSIGEAIGNQLGAPYIDGDEHHSQANVDKMSHGEPLTDADRADWLDRLAGIIADHARNDAPLLIGCSALKRAYRDRLRAGDPNLVFLFLDGTFKVILARMQQREHFFSPQMLVTQFETLETPSDHEAIRIDIDDDFERVVERSITALSSHNR